MRMYVSTCDSILVTCFACFALSQKAFVCLWVCNTHVLECQKAFPK